MSRLMLLFHSKVAIAIIGAVLCGGGAAWIVSTPFDFSSGHTPSAQFQTQAGAAGIAGETAAPGTPQATNTPGSRPSATPTPGSTRQPIPTATPGAGQTVDLHGRVGTVNSAAETFTIRLINGTTKTVVVTAQTTYQGAATSLNTLYSGWRVEVQGVTQADGSIMASVVNESNDD
jgi:hypothetical protein